MGREVRYCRLVKTFDKSVKRLEVNMVPGSLSHSLYHQVGLEALLLDVYKKRMTPLPCQAPPGDLERQLQNYLDDIEDKNKDKWS